MRKQGGFTLIELVAVIVILGALAAVAIPRFVDLQDDARQAGAEGVAGGLAAGSATNFAAKLADADGDFVAVVDCGDTPLTLNSGLMPNGYSIQDETVAPGTVEDGEPFICTVENDADTNATADFTAIAVTSS